jgi:NTP pyrophosphatase (non-canonical NTP hydrolase)
MIDPSQLELAKFALTALSSSIYQSNVKAGWFKDPKTGRKIDRDPMVMLMLIVTEVAEAAEGQRKGIRDTHLPEFPMLIVELADTLVRCFELAGYMQSRHPEERYNLGEAFVAKLLYNDLRLDHKLTERAKPGGKSC